MKIMSSSSQQQAPRSLHDTSSPSDGINSHRNIISSVDMKLVILERLEKELTSKIGGSICRRRLVSSGSVRSLSGKKRRRGESKLKHTSEARGTSFGATKVEDEKVYAPTSIAESVVRSRLIVGRCIYPMCHLIDECYHYTISVHHLMKFSCTHRIISIIFLCN